MERQRSVSQWNDIYQVCVSMERHLPHPLSTQFIKTTAACSFVHSFKQVSYQTIRSLFQQPAQNLTTFGRLSVMNLFKLSFISILATIGVAADTTGGLRHQPVLTPDESVTADTTGGLRHQPVLTPEEFVTAMGGLTASASLEAQMCVAKGKPCVPSKACCWGK